MGTHPIFESDFDCLTDCPQYRMSAGERYSFSLTTFSPSGKLVQIEYALNAVNAGQPTVGIKARDGVVIATEKKHKSNLQDEATYFKVEKNNEPHWHGVRGHGPRLSCAGGRGAQGRLRVQCAVRRAHSHRATRHQTRHRHAELHANGGRATFWLFAARDWP